MTPPDQRHSGLDLHEPAQGPLRCCQCGRFVSQEDARWSHDVGDYGMVYSSEVECPNCVGQCGYDPEFAPGGPASVLGANDVG